MNNEIKNIVIIIIVIIIITIIIIWRFRGKTIYSVSLDSAVVIA